ncbi:MAG: ribose-5-phosphate isomerase [Candidatus Marinimicrobia bacterium]|nr:ribose-5-phosphate isomerase [Candidatus Neomarinimicrobiota bacterium]|tara:strand:+ start:3363 stop:3800 length:438 start_codon:yes stop_codon:yes gene_type:complete
MIIHIATDHAGYDLKNDIKNYLLKKGYEVIDHGAFQYEADDDYPDFIFPCAKAVASDKNSKGIILGGSGQGEAMAANRLKGIRAAVYYGSEADIPLLSRQHNNSNILSIGSRFVSKDQILFVLDKWITEPFSGGRHQRRIDKLDI